MENINYSHKKLLLKLLHVYRKLWILKLIKERNIIVPQFLIQFILSSECWVKMFINSKTLKNKPFLKSKCLSTIHHVSRVHR